MNNETKKNEQPTNTQAMPADPRAAAPAAVTKQESEGWEFAKEVGKTLVIGVAAGAAVYLGTLAAYKLSVACGWLPEEGSNGGTDDGAQA